MFYGDWDSVDGNSLKDRLLAEIEGLDIVVMAQKLESFRKEKEENRQYLCSVGNRFDYRNCDSFCDKTGRKENNSDSISGKERNKREERD